MTENELSYKIIGCAMKVHSALGPGLVERQVALPLIYEDVKLPAGYRIDLFIERRIIVECKAVDILHPVFAAQLQPILSFQDANLAC